MTAPRIVASLAEISADYDAILCDVWGVLHDGRRAFAPASEALVEYRRRGGKVALITNAPRPRAPVEAQLLRFGVSRDAFDAVVTSGDVTIALIEAQGDAPLHHIGPERDLSLFEAVEARTGRRPRRVGPNEAAYIVCTGLENDHTEMPSSYDERLQRLAARRVPFVCANPDIVIHRGAELVYCAGALAQVYEKLGGDVTYAGKPHPPIYDVAFKTLGGAKRVLAIGDGFRTDVAGARGRGLDVLFVAGGIHRDEALSGDEVDAEGAAKLYAREGYTPAATVATLR